MKYAVFGDVHANLEAFQAVLADAREQRCSHYACVGDIVGYNASPKECLDLVRDLGIPCVKGNHDEYCSTDIPLEGINPRAVSAMLWTRQQLSDSDKEWLHALKYTRLIASFSIVHATLDAPERWGYVCDRLAAAASFNYQTTSVCFFGHTHLPMAFVRDSLVRCDPISTFKVETGRKYFVNVGSVGEPRDGNPLAAYVTYDVAKGIIELRRVPFDLEKTEAKLRGAGLSVRRRCSGVS